MQINPAKILPDIKVFTPKTFGDERGFFFESFRETVFQAADLPKFVQDNISRSTYGVLRGMHCQLKYPQGKLVAVIRGEVFDVCVDVRRGSPTFGKWEGFLLNDVKHTMIYVPPGFLHGFCVLSQEVDFYYKCTEYYQPGDECGIIWNDPTLNIAWPKLTVAPNLSKKDMQNKLFAEIDTNLLPQFLAK